MPEVGSTSASSRVTPVSVKHTARAIAVKAVVRLREWTDQCDW